ncbi:MAG: DUF5343 domain-containing protein [Moorellales bacterium]
MAEYAYTSVPARISELLEKIRETGVPTRKVDFWKRYRAGNSKCVLAEAIRQGYADLFATYRDAYNRSDEDLENYFTAKSPHLASLTIRRMIKTFRALCALADFGDNVDSPSLDTGVPVLPSQSPVTGSQSKLQSLGFGSGIRININIQLALPETKDPEFYEQFFSALKKHFVDGGLRNDN